MPEGTNTNNRITYTWFFKTVYSEAQLLNVFNTMRLLDSVVPLGTTGCVMLSLLPTFFITWFDCHSSNNERLHLKDAVCLANV